MSLPWASGPGELLKHGLDLLKTDSDSNRRIAMINIDNSVELMLKTYLGLPKRITNLQIPRKEFQEISESFPSLLDAIEKYSSDRIAGINLGEIEWYHRLRNELYHQGNGLTVEREKVTVYAELANLLFEKLFGEKLLESKDFSSKLLGDFMSLWIEVEKNMTPYLKDGGKDGRIYMNNPQFYLNKGVISKNQYDDFMETKKIRNEVVHGKIDAERVITRDLINKLEEIVVAIRKYEKKES
jgi:hypothetical protein